MEAHSTIRQKTEMWKNDEYIIDFFKKNLKQKEMTDEEIHSICGYIQVKLFNIKTPEIYISF